MTLIDALAHFLETLPTIKHLDVRYDITNTMYLKDKGILTTRNHHHQENIKNLLTYLEDEHKTVIIAILSDGMQKISKKTTKNALNYQDVKIMIPLEVEGVPLTVELQFVLQGNENEKGLASHPVYEIKRNIAALCRMKKFFTHTELDDTIYHEIDENPNLIESIGNGSRENTYQIILEELVNQHTIQSVQHTHHPDQSYWVHTEVMDRLREKEFYPEIGQENNI